MASCALLEIRGKRYTDHHAQAPRDRRQLNTCPEVFGPSKQFFSCCGDMHATLLQAANARHLQLPTQTSLLRLQYNSQVRRYMSQRQPTALAAVEETQHVCQGICELHLDAATCQRQYRAGRHCREAIANCLETRQYSVSILSAFITLTRHEPEEVYVHACGMQVPANQWQDSWVC